MEFRTHFSSNSNLRQIILQYLQDAEDSIYIAVAWFTDPSYFSVLLEKLEEGVKVELIITRHEFNHKANIDFIQITKLGGLFVEIGDEFKLMHNKFCVIDHNFVLNGSFNWTKKANNSNSENLSIISGDPFHANQFFEEFKKLKMLAGLIDEHSGQLSLHSALKHLSIIKTFLEVGDPNKCFPYLQKIKDQVELKHIVDSIYVKEFAKALLEINEYQQRFSQILDISRIEKDFLKSQIRLITVQIQTLEIEKTEIEGKIDHFNHRYILELNPIIIKILALKRKINEKLKKRNVKSEDFDQAERLYDEAIKELESQKEIEFPELNQEQEGDIKELYRNFVKFCHPDSPQCIFEDKTEASKVFAKLSDAYKRNDLESVRYIVSLLTNGSSLYHLESFDEIGFLRTKLETLKARLNTLAFEIEKLKGSEAFIVILQFEDWSKYFNSKKQELENQLEELNHQFVNNGK